MKNRAEKWSSPVLEAPAERRDIFYPYFKQAKSDEVVAILKAREPARIIIAMGPEGGRKSPKLIPNCKERIKKLQRLARKARH